MGRHYYCLRIQEGIKMSTPEYKVQVFDVLTGQEYDRDMSAEEIAALPEVSDDLAG